LPKIASVAKGVSETPARRSDQECLVDYRRAPSEKRACRGIASAEHRTCLKVVPASQERENATGAGVTSRGAHEERVLEEDERRAEAIGLLVSVQNLALHEGAAGCFAAEDVHGAAPCTGRGGDEEIASDDDLVVLPHQRIVAWKRERLLQREGAWGALSHEQPLVYRAHAQRVGVDSDSLPKKQSDVLAVVRPGREDIALEGRMP